MYIILVATLITVSAHAKVLVVRTRFLEALRRLRERYEERKNIWNWYTSIDSPVSRALRIYTLQISRHL